MTVKSHPAPINTEQLNEVVISLVDHLDAMLAYWDINQVCVFANNAYRMWFGKSRQDILGITMQDLLGPLYEKNLPYIQAAYQGQTQVFERTIPTPDGQNRHSLATYTPHIVDNKVRGIFVHVADVTPIKNLEFKLLSAKADAEKMATHDFLTGLPNRVLLLDRIFQAFSHAKRTRRMVAVMSLDIDNFKQINDKYGHPAGDKLLIEFATRLTQLLRGFDSVTRMGGDEFLLFFHDLDAISQAESIAIRILKHTTQPYKLKAKTIRPTCSLGIAMYTPQCKVTAETLIELSDRALYLAKKQGKNCYAFADQLELQ